MSIFSIVFLDQVEIQVEAICFSVAKVEAAHQRVNDGAKTHKQLTADDEKSSKATEKTRGY
jgi:hypothetical protein